MGNDQQIGPVSRLEKRLTRASDQDGVIDAVELERAVGESPGVSQEGLTQAMYATLRKGRRFTDRARAVAFSHVGGLKLPEPRRPIGNGFLDTNNALLEACATLQRWRSEPERVTADEANRLEGCVRRAAVSADQPDRVVTYLTGILREARHELHRLSPAGARLATYIDRVLESCRLDGPGDRNVPRDVRERGFSPFDARIAWHPRRRFDWDPLHCDFVAMLNDLIADGVLDGKDADAIVSHFERLLPHGLFALVAPKAHFFAAADLEGFSCALEELPDRLVEGDARARLQRWVKEQLAGPTRASTSQPLGCQSDLGLPDEPKSQKPASLSDIANDARLVDQYIESIETGQRDPFELYLYAQRDHRLEDPLGDYALAVGSVVTFRRLLSTLFNDNRRAIAEFGHVQRLRRAYADFAPNPLDRRERELNRVEPNERPSRGTARRRESRVNPLRAGHFVEMLTQVMTEERKNGIEPRLGTIHRWGEHFRTNHAAKFLPFTLFPKPLVALAKGETWRFMATGRELPLIERIIARARGTLTFDELFRESYVLNRGDVYLTLLTMENVLAKHWHERNREKLAVTRRLTPISREAGTGDRFGHWYHLVGIMLYGYIAGRAAAGVVGNVETMGGFVLNGFSPEWQGSWINHVGGEIGADLSRVVREKTYLTHRDNRAALSPSYYLDLTTTADAGSTRTPLTR